MATDASTALNFKLRRCPNGDFIAVFDSFFGRCDGSLESRLLRRRSHSGYAAIRDAPLAFATCNLRNIVAAAPLGADCAALQSTAWN